MHCQVTPTPTHSQQSLQKTWPLIKVFWSDCRCRWWKALSPQQFVLSSQIHWATGRYRDILPWKTRKNNLFLKETDPWILLFILSFCACRLYGWSEKLFENYFRYRYSNNTEQKWQDSSKTYFITQRKRVVLTAWIRHTKLHAIVLFLSY